VSLAFRSMALLLVVALHAPRLGARVPVEVDPRLFDATLSPGALIGLESAWIPAHLERYAGIGVMYANDELVAATVAGERVHGPLNTRWITTLGFGLGLLDRLELQLGTSLHAYGDAFAADEDARSFGMGDVRAAVRYALMRAPQGGFGLVAQLGVFFPTGGKVPFSGDGGVVLDPRVVLDWRSSEGIALALHLGYRIRPARQIFDLTIDDEVRYGLGLELPFGALGAAAPLALLAEVEGALGLGTSDADPSGAMSARKRPLEARLGLRAFGEQWALTLAAGAGLSSGYGAPDLRVFVGLSFSPGTLTGPRPMPPPLANAAPEIGPAPSFPVVLGFADPAALDAAMRADPDIDGDGIPVPTDLCPEEREDVDGNADDDGCPDPDNDGDGVLDAADKCPTELETPNGIADDDGCPDEGQVTVVTKNGVIELTQAIEFNSGSDVLAKSAAPLIAQIAAVLKADVGIRRLRIEGHTDGDGDEEMNVDLSERRAARVRQKLMELGVAGARLLPKGYGPTRSIAPNTTPEGRKKNRRVEFRIIDPWPVGVPRVDFDGPVTP